MSLKGRNFLKLLDFTPDEINELLDLAAELKEKKKSGVPHRMFEGKSIEALTRYHLMLWGLEMGEEATNSTPQYTYRTNVMKDRQHGYESWTWSVDAEGTRIPVYRVNRMQNIGHTNSNTEFPLLWDYLGHFRDHIATISPAVFGRKGI